MLTNAEKFKRKQKILSVIYGVGKIIDLPADVYRSRDQYPIAEIVQYGRDLGLSSALIDDWQDRMVRKPGVHPFERFPFNRLLPTPNLHPGSKLSALDNDERDEQELLSKFSSQHGPTQPPDTDAHSPGVAPYPTAPTFD